MKKRSLIRIISYITATFAVAVVFAVSGGIKAARYEMLVEYSYQKSLTDLGTYIENISSALNKGIYCQSATQMSLLSAKLWRESGSAKSSLSSLPVYELNLESTYKFLSQVGEYAMDLSKRVAKTGTVTSEDQKNIDALNEYAKNLSVHINNIINDFNKSSYTMTSVALKQSENIDEGSVPDPSMADGFRDMEDGFESYPTLIYDGPFSDHIMTKEPLFTKGKSEASEEYCLKQSAAISNISYLNLKACGTEDSNLPLLCFENENGQTRTGITKYGGLPAYMLKNRSVSSSQISKKEAESRAAEFLNNTGYSKMKTTYYEIQNNIMIINYAFSENGVLFYPDLIKVGVAMDNGEIVYFDARGFLMNHTSRNLPSEIIPETEAAALLNKKLTLTSTNMTVVPTSGENEVFCYEFLCNGENNQRVLVYINAKTGDEENILLLIENENGTLTI